jgi:hypothetical protein
VRARRTTLLAAVAALTVAVVTLPSPVAGATDPRSPVETAPGVGHRSEPVQRKPSPHPAHLAVPARSGSGRRIVYSERLPQHAWLVDAHGRVARDFAVSGRIDTPHAGTFHVFSKSPSSSNAHYGVTFRWMVRFAVGRSAAIGFHSIPRYYDGRSMQTLAQLGLPVGKGGCPHSADADAEFLYRWANVGTTVVVLH